MIYIFWRLCIIKIKWCWNAYGTGYVPLPAKRRENVTGNIIVKPSVRQRFDSFMERGRVLFFSAPCGFGKSTLSDALLSGRDVLRLNAGAADFALPAPLDGWEILLIDDFQMIPAEDGGQALCELIRSDPGKRFLLLSRGAPPGYLTAFQYSGLMTTLEADDLLFDREDICKYFSGCGVAVTDSEIGGILRESVGYPLGVAVTARCMSGGKPFGPEIVARAFREVFSYFEDAIYRRFDLPVRQFLLELAPFERFNPEMARMVTGDPHAGSRLDWLLSHTTMLRYDDMQHFRFWPQFRDFLLWEMAREYSEEKRRALFSRGALYYELKEDYAHALECYTRCGDHAKVSELLVRNAELHPGMGHYSEMEKYYRSLPEAEIAASPALMQGMSMLCALSMDYDGSRRWYQELQEFARRCGKDDAAGKQARSRLAWLDISLPQRGVEGLTETIPAVFRLMTNKEVSLPSFSVTSALPSIMNGGKDFSVWSKRDDLLYQTLRIPVEAILGRDGVGLADCAVAESKFEKGENITGRMLTILPRISEIHQRGTPDMEFAVNGLLARSLLAAGQSGDAYRTVESLRTKFAEEGQERFLPNMDAMLVRIALHTGDLDHADTWYREKAPRNPMRINIMKRYQYLTQAMVELADGKPGAAMLTLSPLEAYIQDCGRHIDGIHLNVLTAVSLYRSKDETWRQRLTDALDTAAEYHFIRTVSVYGAAVLPLLEKLDWSGSARWRKQLMDDVRLQAAYYPRFLEPRLAPGEALTPTELQILHLICADKSNAEIGQIMDIKLPTVKTHVSHILDKLDVRRRSEAKTAAKRLRLIPEDR